MNYVRSISGSVGAAWNSINPATLSGAIDVIVVEQDDGSLACSPFHIRFGKWRLLRPYEKKVEFKVNGQKQDFPMKLGEGGEAFFVFETNESVPEALQTSPLSSPQLQPANVGGSGSGNGPSTPSLQEPEPFELETSRDGPVRRPHSKSASHGTLAIQYSPIEKAQSDNGRLSPPDHDTSNTLSRARPQSTDFSGYHRQHLMPRLERNATDSDLPTVRAAITQSHNTSQPLIGSTPTPRPAPPMRSRTDYLPPPIDLEDAKSRALNLSRKLWTSNISNQVTDAGDLMLDMTGYHQSNSGSGGEALHAEAIARQLLSEEIDGPYDIGALIGADEKGNIWIYSSEEAKEQAAVLAGKKAANALGAYKPAAYASTDALSDPGYHSDDASSDSQQIHPLGPISHVGQGHGHGHARRDSDSAVGMNSQPSSPSSGVPVATAGEVVTAGDPNKNYAKTLRLTSEQLKTMDLKSGANSMAFTVNRATCHATLWYWKHDVPIVISDIDGTITKSDVLGHVLNTLGRDWTHQGVAKLYTDIASNGYNFLYLTSRSVGQADTTRNYLDGVVQEGAHRLPRGPVILSPDRTIAALRREVYLRKPELFKMACLRDIMALFAGHGGVDDTTASASAGLHGMPPSGPPLPGHLLSGGSHGGLGTNRGKGGSPFYAGFGNRLTDALSYRSVNIPSTRIFTINSNSEVSLDLLSLNNYKTAYGSMREIVDHYFPPVGLLVKGGGEEFTDFNYWRDKPRDMAEWTDSESEDEHDERDVGVGDAERVLRRLDTAKESVLSEDEAGDDLDEEAMLESYLSDPRLSLDESLLEEDVLDEGGAEDEEDLTSSMLQEEEDANGDDEFEVEDARTQGPVTPDPSEQRQLQLEDVDATPGKLSDSPKSGKLTQGLGIT